MGVYAAIILVALLVLSLTVMNTIIVPHGDYSSEVPREFECGSGMRTVSVASGETPGIGLGYTGAYCSYVDGDDRACIALAGLLGLGDDGREDLSTITWFVHWNIRYKSDVGGDVWQPPSETLRLKTGDCEDMAVLAASLAEAAGYRTVLVFEDGHTLMGMECEPWSTDFTVEHGGRVYVTGDPANWRVGYPADAILVSDTPWTPGIIMVSVMLAVLIGVLTTVAVRYRREYVLYIPTSIQQQEANRMECHQG